MGNDRNYEFQPPQMMSLRLQRLADGLGSTVRLAGIYFSGPEDGVVVLLPGEQVVEPSFWEVGEPEEWSELLRVSDDPAILINGSKPWIRKSEYAISGFAQQQVWVRDGFQCAYCGKKMGEALMTIDHFVPLELGGENIPHNYISACKSCNKTKGSMEPLGWCRSRRLSYGSYVTYLRECYVNDHKNMIAQFPFRA